MKALCADCGVDYEGLGVDLVLPDQQWRAIFPEEAGLLCANCICRRAAGLGASVVLGWLDRLDYSQKCHHQSAQHAEDTQQLQERVALYEQTAANHMQTIAALNEEIAKVRVELEAMTAERDKLRAVAARANPPPERAYDCLSMLDAAGMGLAGSPHGNTLTGMVQEITEKLPTAIAERDSLRAELAREKARLDWLEKAKSCHLAWGEGEGKPCSAIDLTSGEDLIGFVQVNLDTGAVTDATIPPSLRAAIDQALSTQAQGE